MDAPATTAEMMLAELASLGMRAARVVTRLVEIEAQAAELVASCMPPAGSVAPLTHEMVVACQGVDMASAHVAEAVPRTEKLARALDRLGRMVRYTLALQRRIEAGWTGVRADNRATMVKRQVARQVGEAIRREAGGDAGCERAERLFDDLIERLDEPGFEAALATLPVEEIVRMLCRDLGLAAQALAAFVPPPGASGPPAPDTG